MEWLVLLCCVSSFFIEISARPDGYIYPRPEPPFIFDEPQTPVYLPPKPPLQDDFPTPVPPVPTYIPPDIYPPLNSPPPFEDVFPPLDDTVPILPPSNQYLPPSTQYGPPVAQYVPPSTQYGPPSTQLRILNMSCLNSRDGSGFFRTNFQMLSRSFPMLDTSSPNCVIQPKTTNSFAIEFDGSRMSECGVRNCDNKMCVILRMGTIRGLRLPEDNLVTLQCHPQEVIVAHTKHLRLNGLEDQKRAAGKIFNTLTGGTQKKFDTHIQVLRKNPETTNFDQLLQQGGTVRLGDELMLRAAVKSGDGWNSMRLGSVIVRSAASQNSLILVDEEGCRRPVVRNICPNQPQQISPLIVQLPFRAFLFQGGSNTDDLLLSVRMFGCLKSRDCVPRNCDDSTQSRTRVARSTSSGNRSENDLIKGWESDFRFSVLLTADEQAPQNNLRKQYATHFTVILLAFMAILTILIYISIKLLKKLCATD